VEILPYKDLKSKDELLPLMDHAFGWPFNPRRYEEFMRLDPRLAKSAVGFAAVERGRLAGFVGVMDVPTRVLEGSIRNVGGVYGVATFPSYVRRHVSTALMEHAHAYFREKGCLFSFLFTQRSLVSHEMYLKLGYADFLDRPSAHKLLKPKKTKAKKKQKAGKLDIERLMLVYERNMKNKAGFAVRDKASWACLRKSEELKAKDCFVSKEGYVLFKENASIWVKGIWVKELVAPNKKEMNRLLALVEARASDMVFDRMVLDEKLAEVYRARGYALQNRSHGVLMVKPLTKNASIKQTYGDHFYLTTLDFF
jgi:GNAT superfamily N-acetyltransferase